MVEVIPAILTNDPIELNDMLTSIEGIFKRAQIDVVDGVYAKNRTVDLSVFSDIETPLLLDYQLMTKEPALWVEKCVRGMADRIIGHVEMMSDQMEFVTKVTSLGIQVGLGLDLETDPTKIESSVLSSLDVILVMSVNAGFGGEVFERKAIQKIKHFKEVRDQENLHYKICVDGGITENLVPEIEAAGADEIAVGRRIFKGDIFRNMKRFEK